MFHVALSQVLAENLALREDPILALTYCGSGSVLVLSCCKNFDNTRDIANDFDD